MRSYGTNKRFNTLPLAVNKNAEERRRVIAKRYSDPTFREDLQRIKYYIGRGLSLEECRDKIECKSDFKWKDLILSLSMSVMNPELIALEFHLRWQLEYQEAAELLEIAKKNNDFDGRSEAIKIMHVISKDDINIKLALGLVKVISDGEGGEGIPQEDVELARERLDHIMRKLELQRMAKQPVTLDVLNRSEPEPTPDRLDSASLVDVHTPGPLTTNSLSEGVPDGSVDLLHPVDPVVVSDQKDPEGSDLLVANVLGSEGLRNNES